MVFFLSKSHFFKKDRLIAGYGTLLSRNAKITREWGTLCHQWFKTWKLIFSVCEAWLVVYCIVNRKITVFFCFVAARPRATRQEEIREIHVIFWLSQIHGTVLFIYTFLTLKRSILLYSGKIAIPHQFVHTKKQFEHTKGLLFPEFTDSLPRSLLRSLLWKPSVPRVIFG